jgi:hypothetical protein
LLDGSRRTKGKVYVGVRSVDFSGGEGGRGASGTEGVSDGIVFFLGAEINVSMIECTDVMSARLHASVPSLLLDKAFNEVLWVHFRTCRFRIHRRPEPLSEGVIGLRF